MDHGAPERQGSGDSVSDEEAWSSEDEIMLASDQEVEDGDEGAVQDPMVDMAG